MRKGVRACVCVSVCVRVYVCMYVRAHACMCVYWHAGVCARVCACLYVYTCMFGFEKHIHLPVLVNADVSKIGFATVRPNV